MSVHPYFKNKFKVFWVSCPFLMFFSYWMILQLYLIHLSGKIVFSTGPRPASPLAGRNIHGPASDVNDGTRVLIKTALRGS
jgi:hypothetical protein